VNREVRWTMPRDDCTVAIIDADDAARRATQCLLQSVGVRAHVFGEAAPVLNWPARQRIRCIIADVFLPEVSGLELLDRLAREPYRPPVILLAAAAEVSTAVEAMRRGALDFLEKPYRPETLLACVHQAFRADEAARRDQELHRLLAVRAARLTPREREVLFLAGAGLTSQAIATRLGVGRKAIESHRGKAMQKMEVKSQALLARMLAVLTDDVAGPLFEHEEKRGCLPVSSLAAAPPRPWPGDAVSPSVSGPPALD
jgi:FixJ family two-component response regulator